MNEAEYFRQASIDADFRQQKILEQREQKKFYFGWFLCGIALVTIFTLVSGLTEGKWLLGFGSYGLLAVPAMIYSNSRTRLAALEAMDREAAASTDKSAAAIAT